MISTEKKQNFDRKLPVILLKLSIVLCAIYIISVLTNQPDVKQSRKNYEHSRTGLFFLQKQNEPSRDEQRIARHFTMDTLPGLMRRGLIKKYERYETGTLLLVTGKIWKDRSRFFKECLLTEMLVYNQVNGYALGIRVLDSSSRQLYAHALSAERKEFFD
jgi:hypothetical protein